MKINKIISKVTIISSYILAILLIIAVILKLTNHSPTIEEVLLGFLALNLTLTYYIIIQHSKTNSRLQRLIGEFSFYKKKIDAIGSDLKQHLSKSKA